MLKLESQSSTGGDQNVDKDLGASQGLGPGKVPYLSLPNPIGPLQTRSPLLC